jgi:hypothetical protein
MTSNINIRFDNPAYISIGNSKDQIEILFANPKLFQSVLTPFLFLPENVTLKHEINRQLSTNSQQIDSNTINKLCQTLLWTSGIAGFFFGGSIGAILIFLPNVVLIVHMFASSLNFPVNL